MELGVFGTGWAYAGILLYVGGKDVAIYASLWVVSRYSARAMEILA